MRDLQVPIPGSRDTLHCRIEGRGPTLVVQAPGWGTGVALYEQTLSPLTEHFRLITYPPRGSGSSADGGTTSDLHIGQQAEDLHHLVTHLDLNRFSLLGHSHGAWIALLYAIRHGHSLDHLVLVGAEVDHIDGFDEAQLAFITSRRTQPAWEEACRAFDKTMEHGFDAMRSDEDLVRWFQTVLPLYAHDPETLTRAFGACEMPPLRLETFRTAQKTNHQFQVLQDLHLVTCPTQVVTGTAEWTGIRMLADRLVAGLPRGVRVDIAEAGHFPWLERPEAFFTAVQRALGSD